LYNRKNFAIMLLYIKNQKMKNKYLILSFAYVFAISLGVLANANVNAGALNSVEVRFDRMKISTATTGTVCADVTAANGTENEVQVTFPTGYTVSTTLGNWTVSTTNLAWPTGSSAWPGIGTATAASGQIVTFPSSDITSDGLYCFNWTNTAALSTKSSATNDNNGTVATLASGPTTIDSSNFATATISDDQIVVTASVAETFSFALSANTDNLGQLSTSSVTPSPTPRTATISTNAKNGWQAWAKDSNAGLTSAFASHTINSTTPGTNSTLSGGTEGYNLGITSSQVGGTGTISVATAFVGGSLGRGGGLDTSLRTLASSDGTADNSTLTMTNNAAISPATPAATDYTDTITVIAAALF
jgi:hypothetical protein